MKRVLLVVAVLVICGGIAMGVRVWTAGESELEVVTVVPPAELVPLAETLVVDTTGMDTCPGFTIQVPGPPLGPPTMGEDRFSTLGTVLLGPPGSAALFVCYGSTAQLGELRNYTDTFLKDPVEGTTITGTSLELRYGFGEMVRRDSTFGEASVISDLYFEHEGWIYGAGFLRSPQDSAALEATFESILLSWVWS